VKVIGERDIYTPLATCIAECPRCHDRQTIYASRVVSISEDKEETNRGIVEG
jgi:hypothetical protein